MNASKIILLTGAAAVPLVLLLLSVGRPGAVTRLDSHAAEGVVDAVTPTNGQRESIAPIPQPPALDARKVALGKKLFHDPILSRDRSISCASCHALDQGGTDRRPRAIGIDGKQGAVNSPTVFNSGLNFRQFWDGRAESLEAQVDGPLRSAHEMGSSWSELLGRLQHEPTYSAAFKSIFASEVQRGQVEQVIAEFERSLVTPGARFDRFLLGDGTALTADERAGYAKFKNYGCISCHQGVNVGANMFQRMGVMGDYFADRGAVTKADYGRFNATGDEADRFFFKVPSLRNVARTAPYFHDGSAATLQEAVAVMAKYQLGRPLPAEDISHIVKFLESLTGEYEGRPL